MTVEEGVIAKRSPIFGGVVFISLIYRSYQRAATCSQVGDDYCRVRGPIKVLFPPKEGPKVVQDGRTFKAP